MNRFIGAVCILVMAVIFGRLVMLTALLDGMPSMITALSVMTAALLVRLNRGMPSLDWKTIEPEKRSGLTAAIYQVTKEYAQIAALNAILLVALVWLVVLGKACIMANLSPMAQSVVSSLLGAGLTASLGRMSYVVWRDVDIVRLQRDLIDTAAIKEIKAAELVEAERRAASMKASSIRPDPSGLQITPSK